MVEHSPQTLASKQKATTPSKGTGALTGSGDVSNGVSDQWRAGQSSLLRVWPFS